MIPVKSRGDETLETLLNKATNPSNVTEDWGNITLFCDLVKDEIEGPQIAVKLLSHKIQSPQEKEALYALTVVDTCVRRCGPRFHSEMGKFRFLNEIIKVISPKYLGSYCSENVKRKCVEYLYCWYKGLPDETKIAEAYLMLRQQGLIKQDPTHLDSQIFKVNSPAPRTPSIFDQNEKSKELSKLLKSRRPEDLHAANRLIKSMVQEDNYRIEKISKRISELETVRNNTKLLDEMLSHYQPGQTVTEDLEIMRELANNLEQARPALFRLGQDADDKDQEGLNEIIRTSDDANTVINRYKSLMGDSTTSSAVPRTTNQFPEVDLLSVGDHISAIQDDLLSSDLASLGLSLSSPHLPTQSLHPMQEPAGSTTASITPTLAQTHLQIMQQYEISQKPLSLPLGSGLSSLRLESNYSSNVNTTTSQSANPYAALMSNGTTSKMMSLTSSTATPVSSVFTPSQPQITPSSKAFDDLQVWSKEFYDGKTATSSSLLLDPTISDKKELPTSAVKTAQSTTVNDKSLLDLDGDDFMLSTQITQPTGNFPMNSNSPLIQSAPSLPEPVTLDETSGDDAFLLDLGGSSGSSKAASQSHSASTSLNFDPPNAAASRVNFVDLHRVPEIKLSDIRPHPLHSPTQIHSDEHRVRMQLHFTKEPVKGPLPGESLEAATCQVHVLVVVITSENEAEVSQIRLQLVAPKTCRVRLLPASSDTLPGYSSFVPPSSIHQVLLVDNPDKEQLRLKYHLSYELDGDIVHQSGTVDKIPQL